MPEDVVVPMDNFLELIPSPNDAIYLQLLHSRNGVQMYLRYAFLRPCTTAHLRLAKWCHQYSGRRIMTNIQYTSVASRSRCEIINVRNE